MVGEDSLFHGKAVLVEAAVDPEDISLELLAESVGLDFLAHALLEEDPASVVVVDVEGFGRPVGGVGDAELRKPRLTFMVITK